MIEFAKSLLLTWVALVVSAQASPAQATANPFAPIQVWNSPVNLANSSVDFDGDGFFDRIVGGSGMVWIAFGQAGGTFGQTNVVITGTSQFYGYIEPIDWNRDGLVDLIVGHINASPPWSYELYINDGARGVLPPRPFPVDPTAIGMDFHRLQIMEIPGNGPPAIVVTTLVSQLTTSPVRYVLWALVYDPGTTAWRTEAIGSVPVPAPLVRVQPFVSRLRASAGPVGDFNGDGITDWLWEAYRPTVGLPTSAVTLSYWFVIPGLPQSPWFDLQNTYSFQIVPSPVPAGAVEQRTQSSEISDMNGDGIADFITYMTDVSIIYGTVSQPSTFILNFSGFFVTFGSSVVPPGTSWIVSSPTIEGSPQQAPFNDFDSDGVVDFLTLSRQANSSPFEHELRLYRGNLDGTFSNPMIHEVPWGFVVAPGRAIDLDGDGDLDVLDDSQTFNPPRPITAQLNESILGSGYPAVSGVTPRILRGSAQLGSASFGIGVDLAPASAPALLAVSLARAGPTTPAPIGVDLSQLLWPLGAIGPTSTDFRGVAIQPLPLPREVRLTGATLYFQWAIASQNGLGYCTTPTAKVILWP